MLTPQSISRRALLKSTSLGFGTLALSTLLSEQVSAKPGPLAPKSPHFPAKAKRVIFLCMRGAP
ncbi:MAG: DUF1501 domain-containing protein, partial [Planctomycetaceae bacterium]|nr:DUF1501 domain-containing protein [Planctomycetaceae bacterium]